MPEYKGLDVSEWQGDIDWAKVKAAGYTFVILRAGYGKYITQKDKKFEQNYAGAKKVGLNVGAYWYSYAVNANDAAIEAKVCIEAIRGKTFEYPVFLDIEEQRQMSKSIVSAVIPAFLEPLKSAGYYVGLYSFRNFQKAYIDDKFVKNYDFWLAHVTSKTDYVGHKIWQYTFTAKTPGIAGTIDEDICYVDYPSIIKKKGKNGFVVNESTQTTTTTKPATSTTTPAQQTTTTTPAQSTKPATTTSLKAGLQVKLNKTALYSTANIANKSGEKSGTYYIYSTEVVNGRVRITNSISNVGRKPIGNYVTGWVKMSDIGVTTGTPAAPAQTSTTQQPAASKPSVTVTQGAKIQLNKAPLYASATTTVKAATKTGTYYIYNSTISNGRVRITNDPSRVNKQPVGLNVTGWINVSDIK